MNPKIEIKSYTEEGYKAVITYDSWRVAILNYIDELLPEKLDHFQAHLMTDEVFILLDGKCILFLADMTMNQLTNIEGINMIPGTIYNVKKGVYHTHTLSKDGRVLIVENDDTTDVNSPKYRIDSHVNQQLLSIKNTMWKVE